MLQQSTGSYSEPLITPLAWVEDAVASARRTLSTLDAERLPDGSSGGSPTWRRPLITLIDAVEGTWQTILEQIAAAVSDVSSAWHGPVTYTVHGEGSAGDITDLRRARATSTAERLEQGVNAALVRLDASHVQCSSAIRRAAFGKPTGDDVAVELRAQGTRADILRAVESEHEQMLRVTVLKLLHHYCQREDETAIWLIASWLPDWAVGRGRVDLPSLRELRSVVLEALPPGHRRQAWQLLSMVEPGVSADRGLGTAVIQIPVWAEHTMQRVGRWARTGAAQ